MPLQLMARNPGSRGGTPVGGASAESGILGPGGLPNPSLEAMSLAAALGTGPLALASESSLGIPGRGAEALQATTRGRMSPDLGPLLCFVSQRRDGL